MKTVSRAALCVLAGVVVFATTASAQVTYTVRDAASGASFSFVEQQLLTQADLGQLSSFTFTPQNCGGCSTGYSATFDHDTLLSYQTPSLNGEYFYDSDLTVPGVYGPCCSNPGIGQFSLSTTTLTISEPLGSQFAQLVSNSWIINPFTQAGAINGNFAPTLGTMNLTDLANLGGFDHFNILQEVVSADSGGIPIISDRFQMIGPDPMLGGNSPLQKDDLYPYYYEETPVPFAFMPMYDDPSVNDGSKLYWGDAPNLSALNAGTVLTFEDFLVGVYPDHSGVVISDAFPDAENVNFAWQYTQGLSGGTSEDLEQFSSYLDAVPGSDASINFMGFFGEDPTELSQISAPLDVPTMVPEPITLSLFAAGLAGAFVIRRKTAKRAS